MPEDSPTHAGVKWNIRRMSSNENAFEIHLDRTVDFLNRKNLKGFRTATARTGLQTILTAVHGADHLAAAEQPFGQRAISMRTPVGRGKDPAVTLSEYGELLASNHIAASL